jgi:hypothetical protein
VAGLPLAFQCPCASIDPDLPQPTRPIDEKPCKQSPRSVAVLDVCGCDRQPKNEAVGVYQDGRGRGLAVASIHYRRKKRVDLHSDGESQWVLPGALRPTSKPARMKAGANDVLPPSNGSPQAKQTAPWKSRLKSAPINVGCAERLLTKCQPGKHPRLTQFELQPLKSSRRCIIAVVR